jgi:Domain of unknown function (DUF4251)
MSFEPSSEKYLMKNRQHTLFKSALALIAVFFAIAVHAQGLDKAVVQKLVQSKNFVFKAQTALPLTGGIRQLTPDYEVRFLGDSVVSYLPYFGRAYSAPLPNDNGLDFTSTKFEYKASQKKKGKWEIEINPKDTRDVRQMNLTVTESGYATLQVTSDNRQSISFDGYIVDRK